ncbi:hypothetical protein EW145_g1558 [Phellinidium pouzarii]|uniref:BZIP domain-containing protein n=1 Tax=Phellinidium pouzarii TaxID=167371 RepID=A0A4S4LJM8_9AGAM|nr:hypothetical protein EW145_g1558 [Phellinidium pouzarii]
MDFEPAQARRMLHPGLTFDTESASALFAWENIQHQSPFHRAEQVAVPSMPTETQSVFGYRPATGFSQEPMVGTAMSTRTSVKAFLPSLPLSPTPLSLSEMKMLEYSTGTRIGHGSEVADSRGRRMHCLPTNHRFDFNFSLPHLDLSQHPHPSLPTPLPSPTNTATASNNSMLNILPQSLVSSAASEASSSASSTKRSSSHSDCSASMTTVATKRQRACMNSKDFVPPDVTGLSKREARLVKNRAAAFLSRQRKREEFELMEERVAELEQENERLRRLAGAGGRSSYSPLSSSSECTELDQLREQLAEARHRQAELEHRLETSQQQYKVKSEMYEPMLSEGTCSGASSPFMGPGSLKNIVTNPKGGASLGLMVLLCALPSLLSHPSSHSRSTLPTSRSFLDNIKWDAPAYFSVPTDGLGAPSALDWEFDYPGTGFSSGVGQNVDMDVDCNNNVAEASESNAWKKLELEGDNDLGLGDLGLGALDISFDTRRTKDGKIRVRVHSAPALQQTQKLEQHTPSPEPRADGSLTLPIAVPSPTNEEFLFSSLSFPPQVQTQEHSQVQSHTDPLSFSYIDADPLGPFLGAFEGSAPCRLPEYPFDYYTSGGMCVPSSRDTTTRRRVRIALKSFPQPGGEGGEWEVEVR